MGACASKMKNVAASVDREYIALAVKARKVDVAHKTEALVAQWQSRIAAGNTVSLSRAEMLPQKDLTGIPLTLGPSSSQRELMLSSLYVTSNTLYRDAMKAEVWEEMAAGMRARKLPDALIKHGAMVNNAALDFAFGKAIDSMRSSIDKGEPLVKPEDEDAAREYMRRKAAAGNPAPAAAAANQALVPGSLPQAQVQQQQQQQQQQLEQPHVEVQPSSAAVPPPAAAAPLPAKELPALDPLLSKSAPLPPIASKPPSLFDFSKEPGQQQAGAGTMVASDPPLLSDYSNAKEGAAEYPIGAEQTMLGQQQPASYETNHAIRVQV